MCVFLPKSFDVGRTMKPLSPHVEGVSYPIIGSFVPFSPSTSLLQAYVDIMPGTTQSYSPVYSSFLKDSFKLLALVSGIICSSKSKYVSNSCM